MGKLYCFLVNMVESERRTTEKGRQADKHTDRQLIKEKTSEIKAEGELLQDREIPVIQTKTERERHTHGQSE